MKLIKVLNLFLIFFSNCLFYGMIVAFVGYVYYSQNLPSVETLKDVKLKTPLKILSKDGELMAVFGVQRHSALKYDEMPTLLINAIIATEDSRFYEHGGVDLIGILRAMYVGLKNRSFLQGGSTITQQVAKNVFLTSEKSLSRKAKEIILAIRMEKELSKQEILALYLNMINFGSRSYGVASAAYTFFGKTVNELTIDEVALLAGLPNAPSAYNPISYPQRALVRRNWVLYRMFEQHYITQTEYKTALEKPLNVSYHAPDINFSDPYIAEMARQFMYDKFGERTYTDGYIVYTTISKKDQLAAKKAVHKGIVDYDIRHGYRGPEKILWQENEVRWSFDRIKNVLNNYGCYDEMCPAVVIKASAETATAVLSNNINIIIPFEGMKWAKPFINDASQGPSPEKVSDTLKPGQLIWVKKSDNMWNLAQIPSVNGALVSLDSDTGAIKAIVGGYNFTLSKFNRATQALRQLGSNIKPFIYSAALEKGLTMATLLNDAPILRSSGTEGWRPKNYPPNYLGPLRLRVGLGMSKNVMMVRALRAIGINYAAEYLQKFGFPKENIPYNESLALGSASFTPLQVARAYSVIVNGGYLITPYLIEKIEDDNGKQIVYQHQPEIACSNCTTQLHDNKIGSASLKNVEYAAYAPGNEEPDKNNLKADDSLILPDIRTNSKVINLTPKYAPQVVRRDITFIMKDGLKSNVFGGDDWMGTAWRVKSLARFDVGGKTGTTNASKDAWFSGFGANIVTTVWMGFDDPRRELGKATREEGGAITVNPAWIDYMRDALNNVPEKEDIQPENVIRIAIDPKTGLLPQFDSHTMDEFFIKGTEPTQYTSKEVETKVSDSNGNVSELF